MFPFTLPGTAFLSFYVVFSVLVLAVYFYLQSRSERSPRLSELTGDPYRIACLRASRDEAVRVAIFNLVDRGLLEADGIAITARPEVDAGILRRPLDRAIMHCCAKPVATSSLLEDPRVAAACAEYESQLARDGLLPDEKELIARLKAFGIVLAILGGVAVARLAQAFIRGQANVFFLIVLAAAALWLAWRIHGRRTTASGRRALSSLSTLAKRLRSRSIMLNPGGTTNDALLLASVYGLSALPASAFPFVRELFPKARKANSSFLGDSGVSCGSCGSSSSSGCGGGGSSGCGGCGGGGGD